MLKTRVINFCGSVTKTARFLNISPAAVSNWSAIIPKERARDLSELTGGALPYEASYYPHSSPTYVLKNSAK